MARVRDARGDRSPSYVLGSGATAMMVLIAALAITAQRAAPPAIAEFAPEAVKQITDAPAEQSSDFGDGAGGTGGEAGTTTTTTSPLAAGVTTTSVPPIERARVRRCVGDPPRQTEDPQSPPCVPYWEGDNGGSTFKNVTRDTIVVALPFGSARVRLALEAYFNKRYEFYGRRLQLVGVGGGDTCAARKASAADASGRVFASLTANSGNAFVCYQIEMARRGLPSVLSSVEFSEQIMQGLDPFMWQYVPGFDVTMRAAGEMICGNLAKKPASYTVDPLLRNQPRKFGVILQNTIRDTEIDLQPLFDEMSKCGERVDPNHVFRLSSNDSAGLDNPQGAQAAVLRLKQDGVTTVLNLGIVFVEQYIPAAADNQQYYPEWIFTNYGGNDLNIGVHAFWPQPSQRQAIIGLSPQPPMRSYALEPAFAAFREVDPTIAYPANLGDLGEFTTQYRSLLVLASGIQMAGPNLTPQTMAAALRRTKFPYPLDDPSLSGDVGFARDHTMADTWTLSWWSDAAISPEGYQSDGSSGAFCYVQQAKRFRLGALPKTDPFFKGPCYTGPG